VKSKEMYFYDQLHGPVQYYGENGNLQMEGNYLWGMKHGIWKFYDHNGKLVKIVQYLYNQPYEEKK
jgi:antitoxin component YwqK of YwqJK toxin-antitoxin module